MQKESAQFSALVYGSFIVSLLEMFEDVEQVNQKLDESGYRIGLRLAHDFARDRDLERVNTIDLVVTEVLSKKWASIAGLTNTQNSVKISKEDKKYVLQFPQSVFTQNVEIPELYRGVHFTGMLPGAIRGVCEIFHQRVNTKLIDISDDLKNGSKVELEFIEEIPIAVPNTDD